MLFHAGFKFNSNRFQWFFAGEWLLIAVLMKTLTTNKNHNRISITVKNFLKPDMIFSLVSPIR